jgi:hypothetical protein
MLEVSSFRDPAGNVVIKDNVIYRYIYKPYFDDYEYFMSTLYNELIGDMLIVPHTEVSRGDEFILIKPELVPLITYPYEWCFGMLRDAALQTLEINERAMYHGLCLKDASAYNMQYFNGKMTLIDTLSFMRWEPGQPWYAYPQFLRHFVNPLLLMANRGADLNKLSEIYLDGIPSKLTAGLMQGRTRLKIGYWAHLFMHNIPGNTSRQDVKMPVYALKSLLGNLKNLLFGLKYTPTNGWVKYQDAGSYTQTAELHKHTVVTDMLKRLPQGTVADFGANNGVYSILAAQNNHKVYSIDSVHDCVQNIYSSVNGVLPLVADICNPPPAIGWDNTERKSLLSRINVDTILALALIHHLCITNNVPLHKVARLFYDHCRHLIVEFVPPDDKQAIKLRGAKNIPMYDYSTFINEFTAYFNIKQETQINDSQRILFLMEKKQ